MPLKMRPTGLGHGVYKDDVDYRAAVIKLTGAKID